METALMISIIARFILTYITPLLDGREIHQYFGNIANTSVVENILAGTYQAHLSSSSTTK